jgi:hypothetical protein
MGGLTGSILSLSFHLGLASLVSSLPHLSPQFAIHQFVLSHHKQLSVTLIQYAHHSSEQETK